MPFWLEVEMWRRLQTTFAGFQLLDSIPSPFMTFLFIHFPSHLVTEAKIEDRSHFQGSHSRRPPSRQGAEMTPFQALPRNLQSLAFRYKPGQEPTPRLIVTGRHCCPAKLYDLRVEAAVLTCPYNKIPQDVIFFSQ